MGRTRKPLALLSRAGRQGNDPGDGAGGFTLLELLIVLLLASGLALVCFNALLADGQLVGRMAEGWRQRQERERALDLIRHDLTQGDDVLLDPDLAQHRCSMNKRQPVLVIATKAGPITYAIGSPPSNIWASRVLLRCGPAFTKAGVWSQKSFLNRVLIDGLQPPETPWQQCPVADGAEVGHSFALPLSVCMEPATRLVTVRLSQGQEDSTASAVVGLHNLMAADSPEDKTNN
ncbi:MAG: prepilin-type N-terminal cleavage/methylation domain-containing protein [Synechococcus sp. SB0662_bin_45]|uniref:Prepilin-type N-terminal cleavage/methylation domain-containing protein n=1 Tax=Synechococcus sp. SB0676_bin_10 TaxID=2604869 RepID=A0A6B1F8B3_9SYNE|nr:prepilin-type N-terminal cleavage/methylation domain-containing protein [Cyanobacteria bacterium MAG IRC3_bin_20]MXW12659.1 prepilin-type N-terminal cleavage/methylation domain-containing protein [Synechococcus sp. SB0668_bin_13]MXY19623.1 prepilin-type N-terminal cleavage/methylation domain-containing protein [Synechococcus sp. SB0664_bin_36]MYE21583.1 prepilin-type N-terminal cleavage/methylation domain-containing protein [Synechococcus sp. SB0662_bin_45]MYG39019.1 prepilin-type N-terminal